MEINKNYVGYLLARVRLTHSRNAVGPAGVAPPPPPPARAAPPRQRPRLPAVSTI